MMDSGKKWEEVRRCKVESKVAFRRANERARGLSEVLSYKFGFRQSVMMEEKAAGRRD